MNHNLALQTIKFMSVRFDVVQCDPRALKRRWILCGVNLIKPARFLSMVSGLWHT